MITLVRAADTRAQTATDAVLDHLAAISEQHAVKALENVGTALERTDRDAARDSQAYSQTAKNLVGIIRDVRQPENAAGGAAGGSLNVFILRVGEQVQAKGQGEAIDGATRVTELGESANQAVSTTCVETEAKRIQ